MITLNKKNSIKKNIIEIIKIISKTKKIMKLNKIKMNKISNKMITMLNYKYKKKRLRHKKK